MAQHSTTGYSSWKFGFDLTNIICKQGNHQSPKNKDLKKGNCGKQGGEDVDGVRDVDQAGCRVLKSRTWFQIWRVHVHQQNPQDHLGALNYNGYIFRLAHHHHQHHHHHDHRKQGEDNSTPDGSPHPPRLRGPLLCRLHSGKKLPSFFCSSISLYYILYIMKCRSNIVYLYIAWPASLQTPFWKEPSFFFILFLNMSQLLKLSRFQIPMRA